MDLAHGLIWSVNMSALAVAAQGVQVIQPERIKAGHTMYPAQMYVKEHGCLLSVRLQNDFTFEKFKGSVRSLYYWLREQMQQRSYLGFHSVGCIKPNLLPSV